MSFFCSKFYGIEMTLRTLKNRYKSLGLRRRSCPFYMKQKLEREYRKSLGPVVYLIIEAFGTNFVPRVSLFQDSRLKQYC